MDEQKVRAGLLGKLMSWISEEYWGAGWLSGLEHILGDALTGRRKNVCSPEEIEELNYLSKKCGGWIVWDEQAKGERLVPMDEWLRLYEANRHVYSEEKDN